jgi:hypothetical protein
LLVTRFLSKAEALGRYTAKNALAERHPGRWLRVRWWSPRDQDSTVSTSSKPAAPVTAKRARKPAAEPDARPFLRFHHTQELRARTLEVLEIVEGAEKAGIHAGRLTDLVLELMDRGMDQYFLQSLKATKANFVVQQSAAMGLAGVQKVMGTVIRNILGRMGDRQLVSVCGSIRQFMV